MVGSVQSLALIHETTQERSHMDDNNSPGLPDFGTQVHGSTALRQEGDTRTDITSQALVIISAALKQVAENHGKTHPEFQLPVTNVGVLRNLRASELKVAEQFDDERFLVSANFQLNGPSPQAFECDTELSLGDLNRSLARDDIRICASRRLSDVSIDQTRLHLELVADVPVSLRFESSSNFSEIVCHMNNFACSGEQLWYLDPEAVDATLLQRLSQILQGEQDSTFFDMACFSRDPLAETQAQIEVINESALREGYTADVVCFEKSRKALEKRIELTYWGDSTIASSDTAEIKIGRRPPVDLKIASRFVSRLHATIVVNRNTFTLRDHSSNGTYVKPDRKPMFSLRYSSHVLRGSGVISLGEEIDSDNPHLIYYRII